MAGTMADAMARMELRAGEFNARLAKVQNQLDGLEGPAFVRMQSRRLIKKWAFLAPIKSGRLRAGFWPAAMALQMTNIYTSYGNHNEGVGINRTTDRKKPSMTIVNSVPYVGNAGGRGTGWWHQGLNAIQGRMNADLEKAIKKSWTAGF